MSQEEESLLTSSKAPRVLDNTPTVGYGPEQDKPTMALAVKDTFWGLPLSLNPNRNALDKIEARDKANKRAQLNFVFIARLARIWGIAFQGGRSISTLLLVCCVVLALVATATTLTIYTSLGNFTTAMETHNVQQFISTLIFVVVMITIGAFMIGFSTTLAAYISLRLRRTLTRHVHYRYMRKKTFYILNNMDKRVDNPDQRITDDINNWSQLIVVMFATAGGIPVMVVICAYETYQAVSALGVSITLGLIGYFILGSIFMRFMSNRMVPILFRQDRLEGDFRFAHVHLRNNAESVAFYEGADQQHRYLSHMLRVLLRNFYKSVLASVPIAATTQIFSSLAAMLNVLIPAILLFAGQLNNSPQGSPDAAFLAIYGILAQLTTTGFTALLNQGSNIATIAGMTNRIGEFLEILDDVDAQQEARIYQLAASDEFVVIDSFQQADYVALNKVTCRTPDNLLLVQALDFKLQRGSSLLVIGPSGVGKSSILRVIAGLWPTGDGVVYRPPGIGRDGMFFLPQRPYLVLGSLKQQVLYPLRVPDSTLPDTELEALLRSVDLVHLMTDFDTENTNWETKLSGGEQQRLAMARLFYHQPAFAILDECTSAVSPDVERFFYGRCKELNITCLSVSHNTAVREFHDYTLTLLGHGKWRLTKSAELPAHIAIPTEEWFDEEEARKTAVATGDGVEMDVQGEKAHHSLHRPISEETMVEQEPIESIRDKVHKFSRLDVAQEQLDEFWPTQLTARQLKADNKEVRMKNKINDRAKLNMLFVRRLIRICRIAFGGGCTRSVKWLFVGIFMCLLQAANSVTGPFVTAGVAKGAQSGSLQILIYWLLIVGGSSLAAGIVSALQIMASGMTNLNVRKRLMRYVHYRYLSDKAFYNLLCISNVVDNPDQRLADDVRLFSQSISSVLFGGNGASFIQSLLTLIASIIIVYTSITWRGVVIAFGMAILGFSVSKGLMSVIVPFAFQQDRMEGDFRFAHIRFRNNCESVAFFNGVAQEHAYMNNKLIRLLRNQLDLLLRQLPLQIWVNIYNLYNVIGGLTLPGIIFFTVGFSSDDLLTEFMFIVTAYLSFASNLSQICSIAPSFTDLAGHVSRLGDMLETMDRLAEAQANRPKAAISESRNSIVVRHLDVATPLNNTLLRDVNFTINRGQSIVIMGPSGCGKSSILRTLCGLWYPGNADATISRPLNIGRDGIFFLPQKSYLTLGNLKQQIIYPQSEAEATLTQGELEELLAFLKLGHLLNPVYATADSDEQSKTSQWEDMLSGGERQRIGMARLLYHKPAFAFLDESTSAVSEDVEEEFYKRLKALKIGYVSIGHRPSLERLHDSVLHVQPAAGIVG